MTPQDANVVCTRPDQKSENLSVGSSIKIDQSGTYTFKAIKGNREGRALKLDFDLHKATQATIILDKSPSKPYEGQGPASIINGVQGSNAKYGGSEWLGFSGNDVSGGDEGSHHSIWKEAMKDADFVLYLTDAYKIIKKENTYTRQ